MTAASELSAPGDRLVQLESARGIASIVVVLHHLCLAFLPALKAPVWEGGLEYTPLYLLVGGEGAVAFFFLLSGFVLTRRLYRDGALEPWLCSVIKRLPRLAVPVGASILLGYLILAYAGAPWEAAAALSGSTWLRDFGNAGLPAGFEPSPGDALRQSLFVFLQPYDYYYNSNLWTMGPEFYGSLVLFGLAGLSGLAGAAGLARRRRTAAVTLVHGVLAVLTACFYLPLLPFLAGSYLAFLRAGARRAPRLSGAATAALLAGAALALSFENWTVNTLGALLLMVALLGDRALERRLSGRLGARLGLLSFPLYLVHALVILSVSSAVYAALQGAGAAGALVGLATVAATLLASALLCLPFVVLDSRWAAWLDRAVKAGVGRALAQRAKSARPGALRRGLELSGSGKVAEGVGFEPTVPRRHTRFRVEPVRPLRHPSAGIEGRGT